MTGTTSEGMGTSTLPRVHMHNISQVFGLAKVLDDVNLEVAAGEIRALVGQNGAGKSTLMKVLGGVYPEHHGTVSIDGVEVALTSPRDAQRHGVALIHQELSLIPSLTVAENVMLGMEPGHVFYSRSRTEAAVQEVINRVPMLSKLPLDMPVVELSAGMQQRVEIAKVLSRNVRVLVMDEPTARLSGPEREDLRGLMTQLASEGISIIYISHFLEEVFQACHTVTILRNGLVVGEGDVADFTTESLTRTMLNEELVQEGIDVDSRADRQLADDFVLEMDGIAGARIADISLSLRAGEIVGLAGLVGSGRTRVARTVVGAERVLSGEMRVAGRPIRMATPRAALAQGIVLIPESRKTEGIIGLLSAAHNIVTMALDRGMSWFGVLKRAEMKRAVDKQFVDLQIRPSTPSLSAGRFSGGNQQKLLLARVLLARPQLLVADQPTAGVDVGTKAQIHRLLREMAETGTAVLTASDDLDELIALCDRICVMSGGRVISEHRRSEMDRNKLITAIAGERLS